MDNQIKAAVLQALRAEGKKFDVTQGGWIQYDNGERERLSDAYKRLAGTPMYEMFLSGLSALLILALNKQGREYAIKGGNVVYRYGSFEPLSVAYSRLVGQPDPILQVSR
jgi:hypothetical protein